MACKEVYGNVKGGWGGAVIRDDILVMGYGENEVEANRNDENLARLLEQARKSHPMLKQQQVKSS